MTTPSRIAGLLLLMLAACQPGAAPHPSSPATGLGIAGTVSGVGAVTVRATGPTTASATTDFAGRFSLRDLPRGLYTLSVLAPRTYAFAPASRQVVLLDRDVDGQDFAGSVVAVLQGAVTGPGAAGATVTLQGPAARQVACNAAGFYRVDGLPAGSYALAAGQAGFGYAPVSTLVTLAPGGVTTVDFTSSAQAGAHAIAGAVVGGAPAGVTLTLSGAAGGQTLSDAEGHYRFAGLPDGAYRVVAEPVAGYLWRSRWRPATLAGADLAGLDFTQVVPATPRFAYVVSQAIGAVNFVIHQYAVLPDGALAPLTPGTVDSGAAGPLAADPAGRWLYALDTASSGRIAQFAIGADGALSPLSPAAVTGLSSPRLLAMDPKGRWLWAHNSATGTLFRYALGADGALTYEASVTVGGALDLVLDASGAHLYLLSGGGVAHYLVGADGTLTAATPALAVAPAPAADAAMARMTLDPSGQFAYVTAARWVGGSPGWLLTYAVDAGGTMTSAGAPVVSLGFSTINFGPQQVLVEPSGRFAWVAPDGRAPWPSTTVYFYALGLDGLPVWTNTSLGQGITCPALLAANPAGTRVYVAGPVVNGQSAAGATVGWFDVGADGSLTLGAAQPIGLQAQSILLVSR